MRPTSKYLRVCLAQVLVEFYYSLPANFIVCALARDFADEICDLLMELEQPSNG